MSVLRSAEFRIRQHIEMRCFKGIVQTGASSGRGTEIWVLLSSSRQRLSSVPSEAPRETFVKSKPSSEIIILPSKSLSLSNIFSVHLLPNTGCSAPIPKSWTFECPLVIGVMNSDSCFPLMQDNIYESFALDVIHPFQQSGGLCFGFPMYLALTFILSMAFFRNCTHCQEMWEFHSFVTATFCSRSRTEVISEIIS